MQSESLNTNAERIVNAVSHYCSACRSETHPLSKQSCSEAWVAFASSLDEVMIILSHNQDGYQLLLAWHNQIIHRPSEDINQFINELFDRIIQDKVAIEAIASSYGRQCLWKSLSGIVICLTSPALFIVVFPVMVNPVLIAPLFLLTCVLLPLFGNALINYGVEDYNHRSVLKEVTASFSSTSGIQCRQSFFNAPELKELRSAIATNYACGE